MPSRPQLCAISVAFDDHGEIVPGLGITRKSAPSSAVLSTCGPYVRRRSSLSRSLLVNAREISTKCQNVALTPAMRWAGQVAERPWSSLVMRNGDSAVRPRSERSSAIARVADVKTDYTLRAVVTPPSRPSSFVIPRTGFYCPRNLLLRNEKIRSLARARDDR